MPRKERPRRWTIVQHSGFGYGLDSQFRRGLEVREIGVHGDLSPAVQWDRDQHAVVVAGGLLFDRAIEADQYAEEEPYPGGYSGLIPLAPGGFAAQMVDGLRIYRPVRAPVAA